MNLNFEIDGKVLKRKRHKKNNDFNDLFCSFTFLTKEWKHLEKYVIFWDRKGKSFIEYIGRDTKCKCPLPDALKGASVFYIQVYANDKIYTSKTDVILNVETLVSESEYDEYVLKEINKKIEDLHYYDGKLLIYTNGKLSKTIEIADKNSVHKDDFNGLFDARAELWTQDIIDEINKL